VNEHKQTLIMTQLTYMDLFVRLFVLFCAVLYCAVLCCAMLCCVAQADLKPISCRGGQFDLIKIPLVTLIDTLDTLVVLGNFSEFKRAVRMIDSELPSFDFDVNISVFETTIRILGGLVSAHLMAVDPLLGIYVRAALTCVCVYLVLVSVSLALCFFALLFEYVCACNVHVFDSLK
jgi:hypothetical protein